MKEEFAFGDIVIGNKKANKYNHTYEGTKWVVLEYKQNIRGERCIAVTTEGELKHKLDRGWSLEKIKAQPRWLVHPHCFDLHGFVFSERPNKEIIKHTKLVNFEE